MPITTRMRELGCFSAGLSGSSRDSAFPGMCFLKRLRPWDSGLVAKRSSTSQMTIPRVAIFASKQSHCLQDLLWRVQSGELPMQVPLVIANHPDLEPLCASFEVPFVCVPVSRETKAEAEQRMLQLLKENEVELAVLAKYMQVLSSDFLERFPQVINIHHSFLPAFKGAQPYHRAWDRGVKLIGATAHYVTEDLDDGPIIEQTTVPVSHRDEVEDLIRKGRDTERLALARALRLHLRRQVMVYRGRTAVFA